MSTGTLAGRAKIRFSRRQSLVFKSRIPLFNCIDLRLGLPCLMEVRFKKDCCHCKNFERKARLLTNEFIKKPPIKGGAHLHEADF
jgi:hypothetical protein